MRSSHLVLGVLFGVGVGAACGGSNPPTPQMAPSASSDAPLASGAAVSEPPASPDLMAGIKAFDSGNYAEARKSFESATRKTPSDYQAFYNLGMTCERLGDKPAAEVAYKSALGIRPDFEAAAAELCALYVDEARTDEAVTVARAALVKHPESGALHENIGVALAIRNDQENATHEFEEAVKSQPSEAMFHLTFAHWLNTWHSHGAAPHLDAARVLAKDNYGMIASIGHEYRMAGEFDQCTQTFDRAILMKDGGEVRTERALCRLGLKDDKGTLDDLRAAAAAEPGYAPGHYYLGGRLALAKRFKEAAVEYAKYLELAPNGSLAKPANDRMKAAQEAAKVGGAAKKKN